MSSFILHFICAVIVTMLCAIPCGMRVPTDWLEDGDDADDIDYNDIDNNNKRNCLGPNTLWD